MHGHGGVALAQGVHGEAVAAGVVLEEDAARVLPGEQAGEDGIDDPRRAVTVLRAWMNRQPGAGLALSAPVEEEEEA